MEKGGGMLYRAVGARQGRGSTRMYTAIPRHSGAGSMGSIIYAYSALTYFDLVKIIFMPIG